MLFRSQRGAIMGAGVMLLLTLAPVGVILWAGRSTHIPLWALLFFLGVTVVTCAGLIAALVGRIREIKGGEEDEASKY